MCGRAHDPGIVQLTSIRVDDDAEHRERSASGRSREPGRFHVERERLAGASPALRGALDPIAASDRADVNTEALARQGRSEKRAPRHRDRLPVVGSKLGRADDVAGAELGRDRRAQAGDRDGGCGARGGPCRCALRVLTTHPGARDLERVVATERELLDPQRCQHKQPFAHALPRKRRPRAITGKTSR